MSEAAVDTSSVLAVLLGEPEGPAFADFMAGNQLLMSAGTRIELELVVQRRLPQGGLPRLHALLATLKLTIVPVDEEQARIACEAAHRFGQGRAAPPAVLNFGDLFAYALARARGLPLLFKGEDFARTDIRPACPADPAL
ncbi:type II toxin-antitoxin system VapC family toxin [Aerophototrophica crusticola]|uniref:Type II toxin-antitoxin system VapC family toxin n=1 Tax=Aerophototrophica crusticola TaxID=1709002 RepID=A0A858RAK7_9PROT|nr:type II toxin-antitoxin system VapC family toxin [Rhodospirillaceae bacterium B3]